MHFLCRPIVIQLPLLQYALKTRTVNSKMQVYDPVRKAWVALTPEEHVRQLLLKHFTDEMQYPASLLAVERGLAFGHTMLRFDVAVYHRDSHEPWLLAECKAPGEPINDRVLHQLLQYHSKLPSCRYWLVTNGHETYCADAGNIHRIQWMDSLPAY